MKKVALVACSKKKLPHRASAETLYISTLFKLSLQYARSLNPDYIFILSAKYGLLDLEKVIEPYNLTLNNMPVAAVKDWAAGVIQQLKLRVDPNGHLFVLLAGERYRRFLVSQLPHHIIPLKGLGIGQQLQFVKSRIK